MAEFHHADILVAPVISERTNDLMIHENKYVFLVTPRATKNDIRRAVSERFGVKVAAVNLINLPRKPKRLGRREFLTARRRKAVVTLAEGQRIMELSEAI